MTTSKNSFLHVKTLNGDSSSSKVWRIVRTFAGMDRVPPRIEDIVDRLRPMAAKRTFKSIVGRLVKRCTSWSWEHVHGLKEHVLVKRTFLA
nr:hypothetical protein [Tanacetum cinerariifolium]